MSKPAKPAPFDFGGANLAMLADEAQEMELLHFGEDETPLGVFFMVRGFESATFRGIARKEANADRRREFKATQNKDKEGPRLVEEDEDRGIRLSLSVLVGWRTVVDGKSEPVIYNGGEALEFTPANAEWFLREYPWARAQIDKFAGEVKNFIKG